MATFDGLKRCSAWVAPLTRPGILLRRIRGDDSVVQRPSISLLNSPWLFFYRLRRAALPPHHRQISLAFPAVMARYEGDVGELAALNVLVSDDHTARHNSGGAYVAQHTRTRWASGIGNTK
jgi:hypothetical protein